MPDSGQDASSGSTAATAAQTPAKSASRKSVFLARLSSTIVLWLVVTVGVLLQWNWLFFLLIAALAMLALIECLDLFDTRSEPRFHRWTLGMGAAYLIAVFYACQTGGDRHVEAAHRDILFLVLHLVGLFGVALFRPLNGRQTLDNILASFFGFAYAIFLFTFLARLLYLPGQSGIFYALYALAVTKFTDAGAYAVGTLFGKHKLIPHISPGKTWEGLGGAFLGAYVAGLVLFFAFRSHLGRIDTAHALILPLILGLAAILGDLAESVLKRCAGKKDSGKMLPGIGGALDLVDSLCFTAPLFYFYLNHVVGLTPEG